MISRLFNKIKKRFSLTIESDEGISYYVKTDNDCGVYIPSINRYEDPFVAYEGELTEILYERYGNDWSVKITD